MARIFITGISGTGKTTISKELQKKGYRAISLDEYLGLCKWRNKTTKEAVNYETVLDKDFITTHEWVCDIEKLKQLLNKTEGPIFVLGMAENQKELLPLFDKTLLLTCSPETFIKRIMSRTDNDFGKEKSAQEYILSTYQEFEDQMLQAGAKRIDVEENIAEVTQQILLQAGLAKRYALVYCLEGEVNNKVRDLEKKITDITGSRICLDVWMPHMTIGSGIIITPENKEETDQLFADIAKNQQPFDVTLNGFDGWVNWKGAKKGVTPYVLFIKGELNDKLQQLFNTVRDAISSKYETYLSPIVDYVPHVTIAYSDLSESGYMTGMDYLKSIDFKEVIRVSHIALVIETDGKAIEYKRFNFPK